MKMLGNDVLTQEEFDDFYGNKFEPLEKSINERFSNSKSSIDSLESKYTSIKKVVVIQAIAMVALIVSQLHTFGVF